MTSEQIRYRSDLLGTQVITRDGGRRLGVVSDLWVDVDRKEVVAVGLRESMLSGVMSGTQEIMMLSSIRQIGDVILVDDDTVLEDPSIVEPYSNLVNSEVVTESGEVLGKIRGFKMNVMDGQVAALIIASLGLPQIPDQVLSTYELPVEEIVSSGPERIIVFEGAEDKMVQLTVGVLERLGISAPPWEREDDDYMMPTSTANQLGTGVKTPAESMQRRPDRNWDEDTWEENRQIRQPMRQRQVEPAYEDGNWGQPPAQPTPEPRQREAAYVEDEDLWGTNDGDNQPYDAPPVNIPEKKKVLEYEEEMDY